MVPSQSQPSADDERQHATPAGGSALDYGQSLGGLPTNLFSRLRVSSSNFRNRFSQASLSSVPDLTASGKSSTIPGSRPQSSVSLDSDESTTGAAEQPRPPDEQGLLFDLTSLDTAPTTNAGPSVHVSADEVDSKDTEGSECKESSDEESMPPPWITRKVTTPNKAPLASPAISGTSSPAAPSPTTQNRSSPVISPMQPSSNLDSQSLLRAQLLKSQAQHNPRREDPRQIPAHLPASPSSSVSILPQPVPYNNRDQPPSITGIETNAVVLDARKYYILTSAGKPVWSTEEDRDDREGGDTTGLMGLMQAIISIFEDDGDELR